MPKEEDNAQPADRELVADELESRILFSAAPVDAPDQMAHEAPALQSGFESIDALTHIGTAIPLEPYFAIESIYSEIVEIGDGNYSDAPRVFDHSYQSVYGIDRTFGLEEVGGSLAGVVVTKSFN